MKIRILLRAIIVTLLISESLQAQEIHQSLNCSGGEAIGSGGSVSYSFGQTTYTTNNGITGSIAQGIQQPFEISTVTNLNDNNEIILEMLAYPNPTTNFLQLKTSNYNNENIIYQLTDVNGKLIETKKIENNITNIVMENLTPANYFLTVFINNKETKTFKIIKNK
ncbi:MAG: T9SS type A sorting domain-containing protein [Bacteroidia bacterium]|nr:T9SS type A sorting domain-containing protein [Bacteroidia bacterium]